MQRRIFGVDFSGGAKAGNFIWVAEARPARGGLTITSCRKAADLPGGAADRNSALAALRDFIAAAPDAIFGCDFPFSLPRSLIAHPTWVDFLDGFTHRDADAFRQHCRGQTDGREPKRMTDGEARTPWCAFNIRLRHQTFHGLANLLRPLVAGDRAVVLPMQAPRPDRAWIVETCPASVLIALGHRPPYKGKAGRGEREALLAELVRRGVFRPLPQEIHRMVTENAGGDALDSILAAAAAATALSEIEAGRGGGDALEGRVYYRVS
jgi:hypothetical protein